MSRSSRSRRSIYIVDVFYVREIKKTVALGRLHRIRRKIRRSGLNVAWPGCKGCQRRPRDGLGGRVQGANVAGCRGMMGEGEWRRETGSRGARWVMLRDEMPRGFIEQRRREEKRREKRGERERERKPVEMERECNREGEARGGVL